MKKYLIITSVLLLFTVNAWAGECLPWESVKKADISQTYSHTVHGVKYYKVQESAACLIEQFQSTKVVYGYKNTKLAERFFQIENEKNYKKVLGKLTEVYGIPSFKQDEGWDIYHWKNEEVRVKLKREQDSGLMKVGMYYLPLRDK